MIRRQIARSATVPFLASLMLMTGCTETVDIQLEQKVDAYLVTDSQQSIRLTETDVAYLELNTWLSENRTGWHNTSGRYPGGVYLKSGDDGIQITGMNVVLYSAAGTEPKARFIHHVGKLELSKVRQIGQR
mgnify:CR=1 FL=1